MQPGEKIGRFEVLTRLGEGGMGQTYLCAHPTLGRQVCVKVMRPELTNEPRHRELFHHEALLAASLQHPLIAGVVEVDTDGEYVAYEYVDGCDLRTLLSHGRAFSVELAVYVVMQICRALEYAHNREVDGTASPVIHRDVSPSNIMVDRWGNVKLIDFGIAKPPGEAPSSTHRIRGKLVYMSPEQASGAAVDGRADQYALGVVAYELLVGTRPHDGADDKTTLANILRGERVPLTASAPGLPTGLALVVERMLALRPQNRFATLTAVYDALAGYLPRLGTYRELALRVCEANKAQAEVRSSKPGHLAAAPPSVTHPATPALPPIDRSQTLATPYLPLTLGSRTSSETETSATATTPEGVAQDWLKPAQLLKRLVSTPRSLGIGAVGLALGMMLLALLELQTGADRSRAHSSFQRLRASEADHEATSPATSRPTPSRTPLTIRRAASLPPEQTAQAEPQKSLSSEQTAQTEPQKSLSSEQTAQTKAKRSRRRGGATAAPAAPTTTARSTQTARPPLTGKTGPLARGQQTTLGHPVKQAQAQAQPTANAVTDEPPPLEPTGPKAKAATLSQAATRPAEEGDDPPLQTSKRPRDARVSPDDFKY